MSEPSGFKSGYIAILGAPNVGKSTLLNALVGQKVAIVSSKPQTTRQKILGILNQAEGQLLFLDTPGLHQTSKRLNELMVEEANRALGEADLIYYVVEAGLPKESDLFFVRKIEEARKKYFLIINKVDQIQKLQLLPCIEAWKNKVHPEEIFLLSALKAHGVLDLIKPSLKYLPEGPVYYPADQVTDRDMRFLCAEIIREKLFEATHQEIPYSLAVVIEEYKEEEKIDRISATIYVEKDSQKPIVVGKKGAMLKRIGQAAREEIEDLNQKKVFLTLFVKVVKDWTKQESYLKELGYTNRTV